MAFPRTLSLCTGLFLAPMATANILNVPDEFNTIQDAVDQSTDGDLGQMMKAFERHALDKGSWVHAWRATGL